MRYLLHVLLISLTVVFVMQISSCSSNPADPGPPKITTGAVVDLTTQSITPGGGKVIVDKPGDSLDGLVIDLPAGAYSDTRSFHISYAPITGHEFGESFNPLTPLITIENGGGYSSEIMTLTIPVSVPQGHFPMAVIYDKAGGRLEGMPPVGYTDTSVTVMTANFSHSSVTALAKGTGIQEEAGSTQIVVTSIAERTLELHNQVNSQFRPGVDDWQFVNHGSYLSPKGNCAGMSVGTLWYFLQKRMRGQQQLNGRYDNDWVHATPQIWQDDVEAYRFSSVLQSDYWEGVLGRQFARIQHVTPDRITFNALKYQMLLFGEPQYITVGGTLNGTFVRHALVAYKIVGDNVFISDPNDPGDTNRTITFSGGSFSPYFFGSQGANFPGIPFPQVEYFAQSSVIDFDYARARFGEMIGKTIGSGKFPDYQLEAKNATGQWVPLTDDFVFKTKLPGIRVSEDAIFLPRFEAFGETQAPLVISGENVVLPKTGRQDIGIAIYDKIRGWVGFKWVTVSVAEAAGGEGPRTGTVTGTVVVDGVESQYEGPFTMTGPANGTLRVAIHVRIAPDRILFLLQNAFNGAGSYTLDPSTNFSDIGDAFLLTPPGTLVVSEWSSPDRFSGTFALSLKNDNGTTRSISGTFQFKP
jgi:hypothetical protein